jgi:hypothetical protein
MKQGCTAIFLLITLPILIFACGNNATDPTSAKQVNAKAPTDWKMGVALYSFYQFPFPLRCKKQIVQGSNW